MTVPLALDLTLLPVALVGTGGSLRKRLTFLDAERVANLVIYAPEPDMIVVEAAGKRLTPRLPSEDEIGAYRVLFVAGLPWAMSADLAAQARRRRVLVNVEDNKELCDFHVPAVLRRGALALSISTSGASPTLARRLRSHLGGLFPDHWEERVRRAAALREELRTQGASAAEIAEATDALIEKESWLAG
jgi:precorrin-2 dehydrogenase/sirohydrochlorin ferrochelatase